MSLTSHRRDERGATAVFVALTMVLLLGIAAVAIDATAGMSERRQAQSGTDFAALAAVQFSNLDGAIPAACNAGAITGDAEELARCKGAVEAMTVVQENLPNASLDWATCNDPDAARAALYPEIPNVIIGGSVTPVPCIRFNATTQEARVVLPGLDLATTFGRAIGFNTVTVRTSSEAGGDLPEIFKVIPFGIPANASTTFECLKSGPNPNWGRCYDSSTVGNFGYMDIPLYGNPTLGTTSDNCNPTNNSLLSNIVRGIDHAIGTHLNGTASVANPELRDDSGNDTATEKYVCPIFDSNANSINSQTGNVQSVFDQGMTYGYGASLRGRLWGSGGTQVRNAGGGNPATFIDNTPLWNFLTTYATCPGGVAPTNTSQMQQCLSNWNSADGVIFGTAIKDSTRYAFAPRLHTSFSAASWYMVAEIQPIYLQTSYWGCSSGGGGGAAGTCDIIHAPGESNSGPCSPVATGTPPGSEPPDTTCGVPGTHNKQLNGVTSFILDRGMLPDDALLPFTGGPIIDLALTR